MTEWWKTVSIEYRVSLLVVGILMFLSGMHGLMWHDMQILNEELEQETARLDKAGQVLIQNITLLQSVETDLLELRKDLSFRVQQFPEYKDTKSFRRDVVELAAQKNVTVRVWKPELPLRNLVNAETAIPIAIRVEGEFKKTVQFLNDLRRLSWVQSIGSLILSIKGGSENSPLIITNVEIHGLTPMGMDQIKELLEI